MASLSISGWRRPAVHESTREREVLGGSDDRVEVAVAEHEQPARSQHAPDVGHERVCILETLENVLAHGAVELGGPRRYGLGEVSDDQAQARVADESVGYRLLLGVDTDERAAGSEPPGDLDQRVAATATEIDHMAGWSDVGQAGELAVALGSEHRG